jgi:hypothetical protein
MYLWWPYTSHPGGSSNRGSTLLEADAMTILPHRLGEVKKIRMCQKLRSRVLNEEFCKMHFRHSKICFEAGLPDFYRSKKIPKLYQTKTVKYCKWSFYIPTFFILRPSKIYPNWNFWFENKPSGNPVSKRKKFWKFQFPKSMPNAFSPKKTLHTLSRGKIFQMTIAYTKWPQNTQNDHKIHQMTIKYTKWP